MMLYPTGNMENKQCIKFSTVGDFSDNLKLNVIYPFKIIIKIGNKMELDTFNIISGIITIIAFIFAIWVHLSDKNLKTNLESGLIGIIGNLDNLVYCSNDDTVNKKELAAKSSMIRNQSISLLKSFSDKEERHRTFDFGLSNEENIEKRIKKRKEAIGIDYSGCIVEGQFISTEKDNEEVQNLNINNSVVSYCISADEESNSIIKSNNQHYVSNFIMIDDILSLTANNKIFIKDRGWILASEVTVGDQMLSEDRTFKTINKIELISKKIRVFALKVEPHQNIFVNKLLVHNEEDK